MTKIIWDAIGERRYETGVDRGVLFIPNTSGVYTIGYGWNGLVTVTESPSGAEQTPQYADNIKYLNLTSIEELGGTIEAFSYPDAFGQCDGTAAPQAGLLIGQQNRKSFGLAYRTKVGTDTLGNDAGYKLHLLYGAQAMPSERAYATVNDSPEAITFSWEFMTTSVDVPGYKPTSLITIDSTKVDPTALANLENIIYGTVGVDPRLPLPTEVLALFAGSVVTVDLAATANQPSYVSGTYIVTLPSVTGITWRINGVVKTPGAQPAMTVGQVSVVTATTNTGYVLSPNSDDDWVYPY